MSGLVRHRATMLVAAAFVAALVLSAWLGDRGPAYDQPLDPENPNPAGAQAVAEVLGDHGVDVEVARSAAELDAVDPGPDSVVLVTGSDALGPTTVRRMNAVADGSWSRLKACRSETCRWAFFDAARNRSRAWCDMAVCGNRAKARAYRRRHGRS